MNLVTNIDNFYGYMPKLNIIMSGYFKTWTMDFGLDCGLDCGLNS